MEKKIHALVGRRIEVYVSAIKNRFFSSSGEDRAGEGDDENREKKMQDTSSTPPLVPPV